LSNFPYKKVNGFNTTSENWTEGLHLMSEVL